MTNIRDLGTSALLVCVVGACSGNPSNAATSHRTSALEVASTARCSVSVTKVTYDDPGKDDAEAIELLVAGLDSSVPVKHVTTACDAGLSADGGSGLTLGDCGLTHLELLNGGSGECAVYRTIELSDVVIPSDGYVSLCAAESALGVAGGCDVTMAGRSTLKNGWLQNGPADGLRFLNEAAAPAELSYEGQNASCFSTTPTDLAEESGGVPVDGGELDDVNVLCGAAFEILPETQAPWRAEPDCGGTPSSVAAGVDSTKSDGAALLGSRSGTATVVEPPGGDASDERDPIGSFDVDAGARAPAANGLHAAGEGCSSGGAPVERGMPLVFALGALGAWRARRRGAQAT